MPRIWTDDQRQQAAARARHHRPWLNSTGPRTAQGKQLSSRNSYKHGRYGFDRQVLRWYLRLAAHRVKQAKAAFLNREQKLRNELIENGQLTEVQNPKIMAFYPYFQVHPIDAAIEKANSNKSARKNH